MCSLAVLPAANTKCLARVCIVHGTRFTGGVFWEHAPTFSGLNMCCRVTRWHFQGHKYLTTGANSSCENPSLYSAHETCWNNGVYIQHIQHIAHFCDYFAIADTDHYLTSIHKTNYFQTWSWELFTQIYNSSSSFHMLLLYRQHLEIRVLCCSWCSLEVQNWIIF